MFHYEQMLLQWGGAEIKRRNNRQKRLRKRGDKGKMRLAKKRRKKEEDL